MITRKMLFLNRLCDMGSRSISYAMVALRNNVRDSIVQKVLQGSQMNT